MNYTELHKTTPTTKIYNNYIRTTLDIFYTINYQSFNKM